MGKRAIICRGGVCKLTKMASHTNNQPNLFKPKIKRKKKSKKAKPEKVLKGSGKSKPTVTRPKKLKGKGGKKKKCSKKK